MFFCFSLPFAARGLAVAQQQAIGKERGQALDVAGAHGEENVARSCVVKHDRRDGFQRIKGLRAGNGGGEPLGSDRGVGRLPCGVNGRKIELVGKAQRGGKVVEEVAGAGIGMRLKRHEQAAVFAFQRRERRLDFRGVMGVIVIERDFILIFFLKPTGGGAEVGKRRDAFGGVYPERHAGGDGG